MMAIAFVAIVVLLFPPYFLTQTSKEYFHSLGETVVLLCTLQRESDPLIWTFQFNTTFTTQYSTDNTINPGLEGISGRLRIVNNYALQISTIGKDDEGTYKCQTNINGMMRDHLAILSIVSQTQTNKDNVNRVGDTVILLCTIQREFDQIIWTFQFNTTTFIQYSTDNIINPGLEGISGRLRIVGNYDLQISNIRKDDEGTYKCMSSVNGMFIQHLAILSIVIPPSRLYFRGSLNNKLEGTEGQDLFIRCIADGGKPPPEVTILNDAKPNSTQEVSTNIQAISRIYHHKSVVCQATSDALVNPMTTTVQIHLSLKPLTPVFNTYQLSTEETVPLSVSCTSYGSLPAATFTWTIDGNDYTPNSTTLQPVKEYNDTKTVTSILTINVNKSQNKKSIICNASNTVGSVSARKTLDVKYAPDITVNSPTYTQNDAMRTVTCNPSGNPDNYTYHKWQHMSKYGEIIREFDGNKTLKLPDVPVLFRYQDGGKYVCTSSNGIKDRNSQIEQTGFGYVNMNAQPVFTSETNERLKQFGEINKNIDIYVHVYSVPKFTSFRWTRNGKPISTQNSSKYKSSSYPTIVKNTIHGKVVQQDGYNVTLTVHGLSTEDFTIYAVILKNEFGNIICPIILESSSVPETPGNFSMRETAATSLTVQWDPHFGGGYKQLFYVQYRLKLQGVLEWSTVLVGEENVNASKIRRTYELRNLQEGKAYELRMYAENTAGKRSNVTDVLTVSTETTESSESNVMFSAVIGGVPALVIVCAFVTAILVYKWKKGKYKTKKNDTYFENTGFDEIQKGDEYEEVGKTYDLEHKQSNKTYDLLDARHGLNVYDELENPIGVMSTKSQKALKTQLKPLKKGSENIELNKMKGST